VKPRLEFDWFFSGFTGSPTAASDSLRLFARNSRASTIDPPLTIAFTLKPATGQSFQRAAVDLRLLAGRRGSFSLTFTATSSAIKRKAFEGFYLDGVRLTAVSTR
jgi:hypothetical protein